jgi:hypothetical protein
VAGYEIAVPATLLGAVYFPAARANLLGFASSLAILVGLASIVAASDHDRRDRRYGKTRRDPRPCGGIWTKSADGSSEPNGGPVLDGPAPEIDGERTTGVTLSPEARDLRYLYAIDALRHEVAEVRRSTWPLVAREVVVQLASVRPGGRVGGGVAWSPPGPGVDGDPPGDPGDDPGHGCGPGVAR